MPVYQWDVVMRERETVGEVCCDGAAMLKLDYSNLCQKSTVNMFVLFVVSQYWLTQSHHLGNPHSAVFKSHLENEYTEFNTICMQQQVRKTGVVTPTQQPKKTSENSERVSHPWKAMRSSVKSDQRQYHLMMRGGGRAGKIVPQHSKARLSKPLSITWAGVPVKRKLSCSARSLILFLLNSRALRVCTFFCGEANRKNVSGRGEKERKYFLILSTFAKEKTSN